jgi:hypothetical protein
MYAQLGGAGRVEMDKEAVRFRAGSLPMERNANVEPAAGCALLLLHHGAVGHAR